MKKHFILVVGMVLVSVLSMRAQCISTAIIVDSDGYVNVRESGSSKSPVVTKINSGTIVYMDMSQNGWCPVARTRNGSAIGYIHESRLVEPIQAIIVDDDGPVTNLRNRPSGDVVMKLSTDNVYELELVGCTNGWWKVARVIEYVEMDNGEADEIDVKLPSSDVWIHSSCIANFFIGDGGVTIPLLSAPNKNASCIKSYVSSAELSGVESLLDVSKDFNYVKVRMPDGNIGWLQRKLLCWFYYSICS